MDELLTVVALKSQLGFDFLLEGAFVVTDRMGSDGDSGNISAIVDIALLWESRDMTFIITLPFVKSFTRLLVMVSDLLDEKESDSFQRKHY
jgi:hypothetical protein